MIAVTCTKFAVIGEALLFYPFEFERIKLTASWTRFINWLLDLKKHPEKLKLAIRDGKITALMTIPEAKALVGKENHERKSRRSPPR